MSTNKAWFFPTTGAPEVLQTTQLAMPEPRPGQVLIKVQASGFNPIDCKIRAGLAPIAADDQVPGCDVCGDVVALGAGVERFEIGQRVYGCVGGVKGSSGTLCQYLVADAQLLALAPAGLTAAQAAVVPLVAITAFEALQRMQLQAGDRLLVLGGSGGVGQMAVQQALLQGAQVTATAGTDERRAALQSLGAHACAHDQADKLGVTFDKVLDTHGGDSLQTALRAAAPAGQVATINARNTYDLTQAHAKGLTLHAVFMLLPLLTGKGRAAHGEFLQQLSHWLEQGEIHVPYVETCSAAEVADVHRRYEAGQLKHKVAFTWPL
ncbi:quinone oxidoreductase [Bacterioplanes sanyensis]|uniref:alcohol dehydrogenase catalytic domain-containing protein n=1 Tax=Bacterioplanes sanyensis TaxID=1249553 RepID=UPI00167B6321|nr:zinc-binding dehydrogenase [Bacterioplanes sanyensis]GGY39930.1 quinone oxidoreductase [Bacterioplanes sanyensis]